MKATRIAQLPKFLPYPTRTIAHRLKNAAQMPDHVAHYRILKRLGKGGMGEVFLGEDTKQHHRKMAVKRQGDGVRRKLLK